MDLLDFARGPALQVALAIFVLGMMWRVISLILMPRTKDKSVPRKDAPMAFFAAIREIIRRSKPDTTIAKQSLPVQLNGYVFHIGLAIIVFGFAPHIAFIKDLFGISWPNLPNNLIYAAGVLTVASLVVAIVRRYLDPVLKIISTADDYFSWLVTFMPVFTGLLANSHLLLRYETLLAIHILSFEVFLIWMPFGKLMHGLLVFVTRGQIGAHLARRGAQL
jgi:nitrate reductase gamma subunit